MARDYGVLSLNSQLHTIDQDLVLYIPNVNKKINAEFICNMFKKLNIANVSYIHLQRTDRLHNAATVYMDYWYNNQCVENLQDKVNNQDQQARLIYDDPDHWLLFNNNTWFNGSSSLVSRVASLEDKIDKTNEIIERQTKEIQHLVKTQENFNNAASTNKRKEEAYKNNSCCGAASDAWIPSYPPIRPSSRALEPEEASVHHWQNRLRMRTN